MIRTFELLGKRSTFTLLAYFLEHPTGKAHAQQLGKRIKLSRKAMLDGLHALAGAGILSVEEIGRTKQYSLCRGNPVAKQLKILFTVESVLPFLEKLKGSGVEAYLYGSAARGEDTEASDIDIILIGNADRKSALGAIKATERLKLIYLTFVEYSSLARKDKAFYERVEKDKIRLI